MELVAAIDWSDMFQTIGAYVGIGGLLIAVAMGALSQRNRITLNDLKDALDAKDGLLKTRTEELENERVEKNMAVLEANTAKARLEDYRTHITQGPSIEKMIIEQAKQHKQTMRALSSFSEAQAQTAVAQAKSNEILTELAKQMTKLVSERTQR